MQPKTPSLSGLRLMGWGGLARLAARGRAAGVMRALVFALLLSVALSPLLSRMHHVLHSGHGMTVTAGQAANAQVAPASAERSEFDSLFGSHAEGSQVCQLLDHSSTSDGAAPQMDVPLLDLPALSVLGQLNPSCATGSVAFFQARGPPALL